MLNLEKHISELLYQYDCVIVPNLGGFVANNISADYNEKTGVFFPPVREIGFNRSLSHNDGLLINYIAESEGLTYESCQDKLLKHINILKYQLNRGEVLKIDNVGHLKIDSVGNISFVPNKEQSFNTESFGLSTFHFRTLEQEKEQNLTSRRLVRRTLEVKGVKQIAASIALIIGLWMISPDLNYQAQQSDFSDVLSELKTPERKIESNNTKTIEAVVEDVTAEVEEVKEEVVDIEETKVVTENNYFIIAGSFKEKQPAVEYLYKLHKRGIEKAEIIEGNGRYRISLEGFVSKLDASKALTVYRKKNGFNSAWLLSN